MREFLEAWLASFGRRQRYQPLFIEITHPDAGPLLLLPLVIEQRRAVSALGFIDQGQADYNAPILFPAAAGVLDGLDAAFWQGVLARLPHFDVLRLEKMPHDVGGLTNPLGVLETGAHAQSCHGNDLSRPTREAEAVLASPKEMRSKHRGLAEIGGVEFLVAEDQETGRRLLEELIAHKQRRFEETRVPGFAEKPDALAFLRAADENFWRIGKASICALLVGGEVTAAQWGLMLGDRYYALVTAFAGGRWTRFSCGRLVAFRLLQKLKAEGFAYFDQGYGDETYKLRSTDTAVPLFDAIAAKNLRGQLYLGAGSLTRRLRAMPLWERLRQVKWVIRRRLRPASSRLGSSAD
jgi:CelD/BcsL family acetyltransferase involved in cellulose biosynthesis